MARARPVIVVRSLVRGLLVTVGVSVWAGRAAEAQRRIPPYAEYRADAIVGGGTSAQGGAGIVLPAGVYTRLSVDAAVGATWRGGGSRSAGRVDAIARFLLDPFREMPVGLSLGGGLTVPIEEGARTTRPYLTAVLDLEGRRRGRITPAIQVGLGGGTRIGVVFRTSSRPWR